MSDEQLLSSLRRVVGQMGDSGVPDPDVPFFTLGLSSMAAAQFSGLLEQVNGRGQDIH